MGTDNHFHGLYQLLYTIASPLRFSPGRRVRVTTLHQNHKIISDFTGSLDYFNTVLNRYAYGTFYGTMLVIFSQVSPSIPDFACRNIKSLTVLADAYAQEPTIMCIDALICPCSNV